MNGAATRTDALDPGRLQALLGTRDFGRCCEVLPTCASTNDEAGRRAREGAPHGTLILAEAQTGGRGRLGRAWHSPASVNLYMSIILRPDLAPAGVPPLTLLAGAAVAPALSAELSRAGARVQAQLKWPNDVLLPSAHGPRKVCGILTEMATMKDRVKHVVVGIGINVNLNLDALPEELRGRATSLRAASGQLHDRTALAAAVLNALEPLYQAFHQEGVAFAVRQWRPHALLGHRCEVVREGDGVVRGWARAIDDSGALIIEDEQGVRHRVASGDTNGA